LASSDYTGQVVILNEGRSWTDDQGQGPPAD
jgi:hypothetical protein